MGVLKLDMLENGQAADYFIQALKHQPDNPKAINFGVLGYVLQGKKAEAERWIKKGLELSPNNPGIYGSLIRMKSKLPLEDLLALIPESIRQDTEVACEIARSCQDQQNYTQAIIWAQIALESAPDNVMNSELYSPPSYYIRFKSLSRLLQGKLVKILKSKLLMLLNSGKFTKS